MRLDGKVAVITGGASGIGLATVQRFLAAGAWVAVVDQDAQALKRLPDGVLALEGDVGDPDMVAAHHARIVSELGAPEVLMTSAGISVGKALEDTSPAEWEQVFRVNVTGTFLWMHAVMPAMAAGGSVVLVASQLAQAGGRGNAAYVASKGAVISLARAAALDAAPRGIRVNALLPGAIETPMLARSFARRPDPDAAREASRARHPAGRFGRPEEVAEAALYLASDASGFTTGISLPVDRGWLAG